MFVVDALEDYVVNHMGHLDQTEDGMLSDHEDGQESVLNRMGHLARMEDDRSMLLSDCNDAQES